ncbi:translation initiation factor IF-6 [Candidatus Woesearchaeota archaeon]|nr:translation initiation factor IF-6 [Candidatus Woesearchaeota archaeon]
MHLAKLTIQGNPNVGLYAYANNRYCIVGPGIPEKTMKEIKEALDAEIIVTTICGTSLVGIFLAGNKHGLLIPSIAFPYEIETLKKHGIPCTVLPTRLTALGNNILVNDHGALVNKDFSKQDIEQITQVLNVPVKKGEIASMSNVGSLAAVNNKGCLIHRDVLAFEKEMVEELLKVPCMEGTINLGVSHIHSGIICNDHGLIVGDQCGGPEIVNADEALGFLNR